MHGVNPGGMRGKRGMSESKRNLKENIFNIGGVML